MHRSTSTVHMYVYTCLIFDFLFAQKNDPDLNFIFSDNNDSSIEFLYNTFFPICLSISVIARLTDHYIKYIFGFLTGMAVLFSLLDNILFFNINFTLCMAGILLLLIKTANRKSLRLVNLIDILIFLGLYYQSLMNLMINSKINWHESLLSSKLSFVYWPLMYSTLILINVKLRRPFTQ